MITGRYPFRHGIGYAIASSTDPVLESTEVTLPKVLTAGATGHAHAGLGKWHLGGDNTAPNAIGGWNHFAGSIAGALPNYDRWPKVINGTNFPAYSAYATTDVVDDAVAWIKTQGAKPWFAWVAFNAGHVPLHKPPTDLHSYDALPSGVAGPIANPRPYFEAMIESLDTELGRLLQVVDLEQTTVVFIGDNGSTSTTIQAPYPAERAKGTLYEGGVRVPLLVAGAGVKNPGRETTALVHLTDLFATFVDLTGNSPATPTLAGVRIDSRSLQPILQGQLFAPVMPGILSENFGDTVPDSVAGRAAWDDRFKLIQFASGSYELYDLANDPLEGSNLLAGAGPTGDAATALTRLKGWLATWVEPPRLSSPLLNANGFEVRLAAARGIVFQLQRTIIAADATWQTVVNATHRTENGLEILGDPTPAEANAVYRVIATVP